MDIAQLIERLKEKDQTDEVEFIVVKTNGELVAANVGNQAKPMIKFLKHFG